MLRSRMCASIAAQHAALSGMEQLFTWGIASGPYGFILITNEPDGRARVRINGNQEVHGIV